MKQQPLGVGVERIVSQIAELTVAHMNAEIIVRAMQAIRIG